MTKGWIGVFCSASETVDSRFLSLAEDVGRWIGTRNLGLVYGGAKCGMMGRVANSALKHGAPVFGVLPKSLMTQEIAHESLTQLLLCDTLFERKRLMMEKSDVFLVLPGGLGTLDEFLEVVTHRNLGYHHKVTIVLDHLNFYSTFLNWLQDIGNAGFVRDSGNQFLIARSLEEIDVLFRKE